MDCRLEKRDQRFLRRRASRISAPKPPAISKIELGSGTTGTWVANAAAGQTSRNNPTLVKCVIKLLVARGRAGLRLTPLAGQQNQCAQAARQKQDRAGFRHDRETGERYGRRAQKQNSYCDSTHIAKDGTTSRTDDARYKSMTLKVLVLSLEPPPEAGFFCRVLTSDRVDLLSGASECILSAVRLGRQDSFAHDRIS